LGSAPAETGIVYIGNIYERGNGTTVRKYYYAGAVRVAMRTGVLAVSDLKPVPDQVERTAYNASDRFGHQADLAYTDTAGAAASQ